MTFTVVDPTPLMPSAGKDLLDHFPEAKGTVADRESAAGFIAAVVCLPRHVAGSTELARNSQEVTFTLQPQRDRNQNIADRADAGGPTPAAEQYSAAVTLAETTA